MSGETVITTIGNLVADPELRFSPSGAAVAKFKVASTPRVFDKQTSEWKDGESLFLTCSVWRDQAENVASTLQKGMRVIVQGRLKQRSYEDKEGVKRTVFEVDVEEVAPSLLRATAVVTKASGGQSQGQGRSQFDQARRDSGRQGSDDPWASQPAGQAAGGWGASGGDVPPF